jgi:glycosyltransferase involved in cell wall biosynthesis
MPLRVTFVVNEINLTTGGGSHRTFQLMTTGLRDLGHDVSVIALNEPGPTERAALPYRVTVERGWDRPTGIERLRAIAGILHRHEGSADVYHIFTPSLVLAGGLYRGSGRTPTVATLNGYSMWCTNMSRMDGECQRSCGVIQRTRHANMGPLHKLLSLPFRAIEQQVAFPWLRHIDQFLPASPATQRIYEEAGFDVRRSTLIPDLIDFEAIRVTAERAHHRTNDDGIRHVLFAGRLTPAKGVDLLIDAVPSVRSQVHLHIAGDGPQRMMLEARARELGIADRVTFHGWIPNRDLWDLQQQVDIIVHPGRWPEPCARSVLEAIAHGTPILVSNVGGPPWIVGPYGRTFRPGDPADLAAQLDGMCAEYANVTVAARQGIERAAEFDYRPWLPKIVDVYRSAIDRQAFAVAHGHELVGGRRS